MLNFGIVEILVVLALALVFIGPERLPEVLRFLGRQYGRLMRTSNELRRAFMLEAERSDIEKRAEVMRQRREEARRRLAEQRARTAADSASEAPEVEPLAQVASPFGDQPPPPKEDTPA